MSLARVTKIALLAVTAVAAVSSSLLLKQGGFGGGQGDFDKAISVLGLPWASLPWPGFLARHDFVWLIALPFSLNVTTVLIVTGLVKARRGARSSSRQ
jgi:hypothetical protein